MAKLEKIWIKSSKAGPMDEVKTAELITQTGIVNNADQFGKRQVTIIETECWDVMMKSLGTYIDPSARRANLMVKGISLKESKGKIINIGQCKIKIYGETKPCERMDQAFPGLRNAMQPNWHGSVYGCIIKEGTINTLDEVDFD